MVLDVDNQFSQYNLLKRFSVPPLNDVDTLVEKSTDHIYENFGTLFSIPLVYEPVLMLTAHCFDY